MSAKVAVRNVLCFIFLILIGFILAILGTVGTIKGDGGAYTAMMIIGAAMFIGGALLSVFKNNKTKKLLIGFFVAILAITVLVGFNTDTEEEKQAKAAEKAEAWKTKDNSIMADIMLRSYVEKKLVSPKSAKFAPVTDKAARIVERKDDHAYFIKSYVDSDNALGVTIRTYYHGEMKQVADDKWQFIYLEIE